MEYVNRCIKLSLPNDQVIDILGPVISEMKNWLQSDPSIPESCGFLMGYQNRNTKNITLSEITTPQANDERSRFFCRLLDRLHFRTLSYNHEKQNYYMGIWHTHPQTVPHPSAIDWNDWFDTLRKDRTGAEYAVFIIAGTIEFRVWLGEFATGRIVEIFETEMLDGMYVKG